MSLTHVHTIKQGRHFSLRVGRLQSLVGYQTAEAAELPVVTRDGRGYGLVDCLDNLTRKEADTLAPLLDRWLLSMGAFLPPGGSRPSATAQRRSKLESKYQSAMGVPVTAAGIRSQPRTVSDEQFQRNMEASGSGAGSRFVKGGA